MMHALAVPDMPIPGRYEVWATFRGGGSQHVNSWADRREAERNADDTLQHAYHDGRPATAVSVIDTVNRVTVYRKSRSTKRYGR
jgi:hypothetical protein